MGTRRGGLTPSVAWRPSGDLFTIVHLCHLHIDSSRPNGIQLVGMRARVGDQSVHPAGGHGLAHRLLADLRMVGEDDDLLSRTCECAIHRGDDRARRAQSALGAEAIAGNERL